MDTGWVVIWVVCAVSAGVIGKYKRQLWASIAIGVLLGPLGALFVLLSSAKCPFCATSIPTLAKVCPHCTRDLPPA